MDEITVEHEAAGQMKILRAWKEVTEDAGVFTTEEHVLLLGGNDDKIDEAQHRGWYLERHWFVEVYDLATIVEQGKWPIDLPTGEPLISEV